VSHRADTNRFRPPQIQSRISCRNRLVGISYQSALLMMSVIAALAGNFPHPWKRTNFWAPRTTDDSFIGQCLSAHHATKLADLSKRREQRHSAIA